MPDALIDTSFSVLIPSALKYCEAVMLPACRDRNIPYETYRMTHMLIFVGGAGFVGEEYRPFLL